MARSIDLPFGIHCWSNDKNKRSNKSKSPNAQIRVNTLHETNDRRAADGDRELKLTPLSQPNQTVDKGTNLCSHERACDHMPSPLTCRRMFSLLRDVGSKRGSYRNIKSICELTDLSALTSDHKWKMELRLDRSLLNPLRTMLNRLDPRCSERWKNRIYSNPTEIGSYRHVVPWRWIGRICICWNSINIQIDFQI